MRRSLGLLLAMLVAAGLLALVALPTRTDGPPAGVQAALNSYLACRDAPMSRTSAVQRASRARRPGAFTTAMSGSSFGDGVYYRTMVRCGYPTPAPLATGPWGGLVGGDGLRPLSFPPRDLWGILLQADGQTPKVLWVGLHQDLYNAAWVVHEPPAGLSADELATILATIGCDLRSERTVGP